MTELLMLFLIIYRCRNLNRLKMLPKKSRNIARMNALTLIYYCFCFVPLATIERLPIYVRHTEYRYIQNIHTHIHKHTHTRGYDININTCTNVTLQLWHTYGGEYSLKKWGWCPMVFFHPVKRGTDNEKKKGAYMVPYINICNPIRPKGNILNAEISNVS